MRIDFINLQWWVINASFRNANVSVNLLFLMKPSRKRHAIELSVFSIIKCLTQDVTSVCEFLSRVLYSAAHAAHHSWIDAEHLNTGLIYECSNTPGSFWMQRVNKCAIQYRRNFPPTNPCNNRTHLHGIIIVTGLPVMSVKHCIARTWVWNCVFCKYFIRLLLRYKE